MNLVEISTIPTEQLLAELARRQVDVGELLKRLPAAWFNEELQRRQVQGTRNELAEQNQSKLVQDFRHQIDKVNTGRYQEQARQDAANSGRLRPEGTPPPVQLPTQEEIRQGARDKTRYAFPGLA